MHSLHPRCVVLWLIAAAAMAGCGGGGGDPPASAEPPPPVPAPAPAPAPEAAAAWVRYQASWRGTHYTFDGSGPPATLTIAPLPQHGSISAQPVARVEVQLAQAPPVALAAPNSTDAQGRPQFAFDFGQLTHPSIPGHCELQIRITVVDVTGFTYDKSMRTCRASELQFGAFSDYGTTTAAFSFSAAWTLDAVISHRSATGELLDSLGASSPPAFATTLRAAEGDLLDMRFFFSPGGPSATTRVEAGGGSFAESVNASGPSSPKWPFVLLQCCGPKPAGGSADVALRFNGVPARADATYSYTVRVTNPATGEVTRSQSGTAYAVATIPLQVPRGHVIDVDATPDAAGTYVESSITLGRPYDSAHATSNRVGAPARYRVYCCAP